MNPPENLYQYTPENAGVYESLGIKDTTYELGFNEIARLLGDINGKTFLDFGSGTGRSAELLKSLGASKVYGADHDKSMIAEAQKKASEGITFIAMDQTIPLQDSSVDGAISANVFIEIRTQGQMQSVCREVARVVKPQGAFVVMSTNPEAFGHDFKNFRYTRPENIKAGDLAVCTVKSKGKTFDIQDTFWDEKTYRAALEGAGFEIEAVRYPKAEDETKWETDELRVAPFIVSSRE